ncbi:ATP-binding protein [candidate division WOR-3 bacterium]|nr:ATP-binding protein [candidate division WOR-3 bacterium]
MDETLSKEKKTLEELREYTEERLADILSVLSDVALGDLTVEAAVESEDIFGSVAMGVNAMIKGLRELKEQDKEKSLLLEKSNQELEDFVYIVSHDLKAPLRAIIGFAEFLKEDYADRLDAQGQDYVRRMVESAERMQQLINDLLELSRIGRYKNPYVEVNSGDLVRKAVEFINPPDDVKITVADDMPSVFCDEVRIQQVIANLITNAMKYNDKEEKKVEICWIPHDEEGTDEFTVQDNGIGIEEKHLDKIFKIFQRLHSKDEYGGGTGVGLNIVRKIVEQHGGKIWVESKVGKGTCFHFTIRRPEDQEES